MNNRPPDETQRSETSKAPLLAGIRIIFGWAGTRMGQAILLTVGSTVLAGLGALSWLSYNGLCFSQKRFLSNQDYFDAAVSEIIRRDYYIIKTSTPSHNVSTLVPVRKYRDRVDFYETNPSCCQIISHNIGDQGPYVNFGQRLFGYAAKSVSATYIVTYVNKNGHAEQTLATTQYVVTNCGRAWNARH